MRFGMKRQKNKCRVLAMVLAVMMIAGLLSGCGGEYAGLSDRGAASGSAVSGGAVSGQAVNGQKKVTPHQYCTDTNFYSDYADGVLQTRLDGTQEKELKLKDYHELLCVNEGYLYYVTEIDGENTAELVSYEVCRVPVDKDADGEDVVKTEQAEKVISAEEEKVEMVWGMNSRYIIYQITMDDDDVLIRYDIHSREKVRLDAVDEEAGCYLVTDSQLFALTDIGFFLMGMEGTEWTKVSDSEEPYLSETAAWDENAFFYTMPNDRNWGQSTEVWKCNLTGFNDDRVFITKKDLRQKAMEAEGVKADEVDVCGISDLFLEGNRLYIQVQLNWRREGTYHTGYLMFSQQEDETTLRYEKELTGCLKTYGTMRKGEWGYECGTTDGDGTKWKVWEDDMHVNDSCCFGIVNGRAYLWFHDDKKEYGRTGCFELDTASFRWLPEGDVEYRELWWDVPHDTSTMYNSECVVYDPPYFPLYEIQRSGGWGPKYERGEFHENTKN